MEIVNVKISEHKYNVFIGRDLPGHIAKLLSSLSQEQKVLVVTDEFFEKTYAKLIQTSLNDRDFDCSIHVMSGGKSSKSFNEVLRIYGELEVNNFARDSVLIALGGGVVGDLAGFVASTWYRGMAFVHVPTTLMAMIDSSIGGKVAINYRDTINAVGNYYHPDANFMDLNLNTAAIIDQINKDNFLPGLYVVSTPIGNLADITIRALSVLSLSSIILCEDTRTSKKLTIKYGIKNTLKAFHKFNSTKEIPNILRKLKEGLIVSIISDAGTPLISDPGESLVKKCIEEKIPIYSIPGASSVLGSIVISGMDTSKFTFLGFIPQNQKLKESCFERIFYSNETVIIFIDKYRRSNYSIYF